jgi:D-amino peptidase
MRVFISTDLEGISGVTLPAQVRPSGGEMYQQARHLLMGDINAAVQGCVDAGATTIRVMDGHGIPLNVIPEEMHPAAEFICGRGWNLTADLYENIDAALLVGYHAMNRTLDGVLYHTQNSRLDCRYWYNDRELGEIGQSSMRYGHFNIPVVMVTGDDAACREARELLGDEIVTVSVKRGLGRDACVMIPPARAHEMIRAGAAEALRRPRPEPFRLELPIRGRLECLPEPIPEDAPIPTAFDLPHVTYEKVFETAWEIYNFR